MLVSSCQEFADSTEEILEKAELGCKALAYDPNAGKLVEMIEQEQPAAIFLDLQLSGDIANETVLTLKQLFPHVYLLLAVEPPALQGPYHSLVHHADDFIIKPYEAEELVVRVKKAILTTQKKTGANLRAAESRLQAVAENILDVFVQVDERGILEYISPSCERVLGYSVDELSGKVAFDYVHFDDMERIKELFKQMVEGESAENAEFRFRHAQGHHIWVEVVGKSIYDHSGKLSFAAFIIRDITERKSQEKELLKAAQLESITLLAGGIAHDFNNLLAVVLGNISLAKLCLNKPHQILERLERVEKATLQAKDLSTRLIAFSRGELSEKEIVQPSKLIQEAVYLALSDFNVRWFLELPEDLHPLWADEGQLIQVFNNILLNAVQAMPDGGAIKIKGENIEAGNITCRESLTLPAGDYIKITVCDEGPGIAPELLPRIFDPFFTTKPEGYGLGLATAHSIVTKHDGFITVDSSSEGGTAFNIYMPAYKG